jgi:hypothetical protein
VTYVDQLDKNVGFSRARADPLNVLSKNGTLELRRNFFHKTRLQCPQSLKTFRFQWWNSERFVVITR